MIAEALHGKEEWFANINGAPEMMGFDEWGVTLRLPTEHGDLVVMVSKGEPEINFDIDEFREALNRRFEERKTARETMENEQ